MRVPRPDLRGPTLGSGRFSRFAIANAARTQEKAPARVGLNVLGLKARNAAPRCADRGGVTYLWLDHLRSDPVTNPEAKQVLDQKRPGEGA
jgi:hypothetical protein